MNKLYKEAALVRKAISVYGGSFMQAIGNAMDYADHVNLGKIRSTWLADWNIYLEMGMKMERKND